MTDVAAFRAEFPVLASVAYLNTGTQGPIPARAVAAAQEANEADLRRGRGTRAHSERLEAATEQLRAAVARLLACEAEELAITRSTTDGVNTILSALELGPGDEVLTSDEEHPGVLAPIERARRLRGFDVRVVPFGELAGEVGERTRLVACSHVSWITGALVDTAGLAGSSALVLLDGAQGLGAIPLDVRALGCDFYAASGQKWLCGPDGSGYLYVGREQVGRLDPPWPSYVSLADPQRAERLIAHDSAARFDAGVLQGATAAWCSAALEVLAGAGWEWLHERGPALAAWFADELSARGARVTPRGRTTLVAWEEVEPAATVERLAAEGFLVRELPGRGLVRASVGAWSSEDELARLAGLTTR